MRRFSDAFNKLLLLRWQPSYRTEIIAGVVAALVSIVLIGLHGRDLWFFSDVWPVLTTRQVTSLDDLMRDHGGHWMVPQTFLIQGLYHLFGLTYWPWFFIPRLIIYAGLCFALWRTFRWRAIDPMLAFGAYLVLLFLAPSGWQTNIAHIGVLLIECYLLACVILISRVKQPTARHQWALFVLLTFALSTFGSGAAVWGGITLSIILFRKIQAWWPALAGSAMTYVVWYVIYGTRQRPGAMKPSLPSFEAILAAPGQAIHLLSAALEPFLHLPEIFSTFILGGLCAGLLVLVIRKKLTFYETAFLVTTLGFLGLVVLVRTSTGVTTVRAPSYTFATLMFILPPITLLLLCRVPPKWTIPVFIGLLIFAFFHAQNLFRTVEHRAEIRHSTRPRIEAAAWLIAQGEPYVSYARVDYQLVARHLQKLVDDGWQISQIPEDTVLVTTRGLLRMATNAPGIQGIPLKVEQSVQAGCTTVAVGDTLRGTISGSGSIQLKKASRASLFLHWSDEYGRAEQEITAAQNEQFIMFANPKTQAAFSLSGSWTAPIVVCGVAP